MTLIIAKVVELSMLTSVVKVILLLGFVTVVILLVRIINFDDGSVAVLSPTTPTSSNGDKRTNLTDTSGDIPGFPLTLLEGYTIRVFAEGLNGPRVLAFSPGGTLLVSTPSRNQVIALPDINRKGKAQTKKVVVNGENNVHGVAFYGNKLFVAGTDRVVRYNWEENGLQASLDKVLFSLPKNNNHNRRTIAFDSTGRLYVSVGSTCNVCYENDERSGTIIVSDTEGDNPKVFAKGLRNAAFIKSNPETGELWGTEMGRDYLGDNLPPDEINIIKEGKNYGWPVCFGNKVHDTDFDASAVDPCSGTEPPIFEIPAHSAPLGLTFINSPQFPADWQGDLLVAYHGSWNRTAPTGYKVVHLKVDENRITQAEDFLTGFLHEESILGRPVDLLFDSYGNLYISDDKSGSVYIVQKTN